MARILLGVSGGIAAYKALEFTRLATKAGHAVRVIQTEASTRFVGTASFAAHHRRARAHHRVGAATRCAAPSPAIRRPSTRRSRTSRWSSARTLFLIAPASANTIAKLAHGHADNLLTAAALACRRPLIVAPAMNDAMYEHAATQANLADAARRAASTVLEPGHRRARLARRVGRRPAARAARAAGRRRGARSASAPGGRSTASRCS